MVHRHLDGARLQYPRSLRCHLEHLLIGDSTQLAGIGNDTRIGGIDPVHIGEDVATLGLEGGGKRDRRSIRAAAAAEVPEPPRPGVVIRPRGPTPWNPATTATCACAKRVSISAVSIDSIRALPCTPSVRIGICQPSQERALTPRLCKANAISPAVTCSPEETTTSYSRASCKLLIWRVQSTS